MMAFKTRETVALSELLPKWRGEDRLDDIQ